MGHQAAQLGTHLAEKRRRRRVMGVLGRVRKDPPQVAVMRVRVIQPVAATFLQVVLAKRLGHLAQRGNPLAARVARLLLADLVQQAVDVLQLL